MKHEISLFYLALVAANRMLHITLFNTCFSLPDYLEYTSADIYTFLPGTPQLIDTLPPSVQLLQPGYPVHLLLQQRICSCSPMDCINTSFKAENWVPNPRVV